MSVTVNKFLGAIIFITFLVVLQGFSGLLEFDRELIISGEFWRIVTGHLVHANMSHLLLNATAALLIYFTFFVKIKLTELFFYGLLLSTSISMLLLIFLPELDWYIGLSGLLHAMVAAFSVRMIAEGSRAYWAGLGVVWLKVLLESTDTGFLLLNQIGGMTVINEAHFAGICAGTLLSAIWFRFRDFKRSEVFQVS